MSVHRGRTDWGPSISGSTVCFRLWAPAHESISLHLSESEELIALRRQSDGWHQCVTDRAGPGTLYRFVLPDGSQVPDPASRYQPQDVHGPSEVIDLSAHQWRDSGWHGRPWEEAVLYELHVGTFTPEGTFKAAIGKLQHLQQLGITGIEVMPIGDFPGRRNWGYDGVNLFAPESAYGRPEDLQALIDAAHHLGIMVLLDVVYNHFGPEGAYVHSVSPQFFTDRHCTPWGAAINTDGVNAGPVREFFIQNAVYWIREFHFDGLRLDAVHAILDDGPKHLLEVLAERVHEAVRDRHVHLILENEDNQTSRLLRDSNGQPRWYCAQWNDDIHHVLHVAASGERDGYYADYFRNTDRLGRALAQGFAFQGEVMPYRGRTRGEPSGELPPTAFVAFIQNHDQIGNRAFGDRLTATVPSATARAVSAVYLLLPQIPMLFMGEEWAAEQPFPFFCDFEPVLALAVRKGRRAEFARFPQFEDPHARERIPDPTAESTFNAAKLDWGALERAPHRDVLTWYRRILAVRSSHLVPLLSLIKRGGKFRVLGDLAVLVSWPIGETGEQLILEANLSAQHTTRFAVPSVRRLLWQEGVVNVDGDFTPYTVRWTLGT
jgi:malto-oligosyltrehalose trehalohydrolase